MGIDIKDIAQGLGLKPAQVEGLLAILKAGAIENQQLVRMTGLPKSILDDFRQRLNYFFEKPSRLTVLNKEGKKALEKISLHQFNWDYYFFKKPSQKFLAIFEKYLSLRSPSKRKWDQFRATKETVWKRAVLMKRRGDIFGRDILFLGDNDLTAVAVALLGGAKRIFVADIDKDVLMTIKTISRQENLPIEIFKYDVKKKLHPHLGNGFDVVFADPPYTLEGVSLFLSRGIVALRLLPASRLYFCYGQSDRAREKSLAIQEIINQMKLLVEEKLIKFNRYLGAVSIGSSSSLYINSITPQTKPGISGRYEGKIYTWERRENPREYNV